MIRFTPRHHANFHCLQPALLLLSFGPGPMAAVSVCLAQAPEIEIRTRGYELFYHTCTLGRSRSHVAYWSLRHHHQRSWRAPSRFQVHIGLCKLLIQKHDWIRSLAPRLVSSSSASTSFLHPWTRTSGSSQCFSRTTS